MKRVSFLPVELCCPEKGACAFFPSHNIHPLVIEEREIAVRSKSIFKKITEEELRSRTYRIRLFELFPSSVSHDRELWCESLNMVLFSVEITHRYEEWKQEVLNPERVELLLHGCSDHIPEFCRLRQKCHTASDRCVLEEFSLFCDVKIPL